MRELLPGAPEVRERRAAQASVLTGLVGAVVAYLVFRQPFVALFMLFFVATNVLALRGPRQDRLPPEGQVVRLLWQGRPAEARELLQSLPPEANVDLAVHGAVQATTGEPEQGLALIRQEVARRVNLKFAPDLRFRRDESFDEAARIDALLRSERVAQDTARPAPDTSDDDSE